MSNDKSFLPIEGLKTISPAALMVIPPFLTALKEAKLEAGRAAMKVGASLDGFVLDSNYCDVTDPNGINIATDGVVGVIDEFANQFGPYSSPEYLLAAETLCQALNESLAK